MPLAFRTLDRRVVAFGFFNIETDLLLLDHLFFFADRFCGAVVELCARPAAGEDRRALDGWRIDDPRRLGDLHGAIAGRALGGFIGATYRRWPFPSRREEFRQNPDGGRNRAAAEALLLPFAMALSVPLIRCPGGGRFVVGDYAFDGSEFERLIAYVDRGGLPRWRDDVRPPYVAGMMEALRAAGRAPAPFDPDADP
jgi:hypothetical protein